MRPDAYSHPLHGLVVYSVGCLALACRLRHLERMAAVKIDKPGIYVDFPEWAYHQDPCPEPSFNQSIGKVLIAQSALHARTEHPRFATPVAAEDEESEKYVVAKAIGNAAHKLIIGRGKDIAVGDFKAGAATRRRISKTRRWPGAAFRS
jgi:hypothetical protein